MAAGVRSSPVPPETLSARPRRLLAATGGSGARRAHTGRPPTGTALGKLLLQLARENPGWGHGRVQGEPARPGPPSVASTVGGTLPTVGMAPAPRRTGPTWTEFLTHRAEGITAGVFFPLDTVLGRRLSAPAFGEHCTRRRHLAGDTVHPTRDRAVQQTRNPATALGTCRESLRFLLRDRDSRHRQSFDAVFEAEEIEILQTAPRAPGRMPPASG